MAKGNFADKRGLYQIYGQHVVFGPDSLLYIGMTDGQTFLQRFKQHERWLKFECDVTIRLGLLHSDTMALLAEVEALSIWWHSPPYNSQNIWRYKFDEVLHARNWGARGRLVPEYTSDWEEAKIQPPEGEADNR